MSPRFTSTRWRRQLLATFILLALAGCEKDPISATEWLVVNYWATWCGPCRDEIPELNELAERQPGKVSVVGVNFDAPDAAKAAEQIKEMGIHFPVISLQQAAELGLEKPDRLPTTYLLQNKKIQHVLHGPQTLASIQALIMAR